MPETMTRPREPAIASTAAAKASPEATRHGRHEVAQAIALGLQGPQGGALRRVGDMSASALG